MVLLHKRAPLTTQLGFAMSHMVTAAVVADVLGISQQNVYKLGRKDELPFKMHKFGRAYRFKRTDVEEFTGRPLVDEEVNALEAQ